MTCHFIKKLLLQIIRDRNIASDLSQLDNVTGTEYFREITQVDFTGATGRIVFDNNANLIGYYFK